MQPLGGTAQSQKLTPKRKSQKFLTATNMATLEEVVIMLEKAEKAEATLYDPSPKKNL